jgi:hypothetical protein
MNLSKPLQLKDSQNMQVPVTLFGLSLYEMRSFHSSVKIYVVEIWLVTLYSYAGGWPCIKGTFNFRIHTLFFISPGRTGNLRIAI